MIPKKEALFLKKVYDKVKVHGRYEMSDFSQEEKKMASALSCYGYFQRVSKKKNQNQ